MRLYRHQKSGYRSTIPLSCCVTKNNVIPEIKVGIPIVSPENTSEPPKRSAYTLADETMIKKESYSRYHKMGASQSVSVSSSGNTVWLTWKIQFPPMMIKRDLRLGNLNSWFIDGISFSFLGSDTRLSLVFEARLENLEAYETSLGCEGDATKSS